MTVIYKCVQLLIIVTQIITYYKIHGFDLSNAKEVTKLLNGLIEKFEKDPTDERFQGVILPPTSLVGKTQREFLMPKVLLFSPQEQYNCPINCPLHNTPLKPWHWMADLSGKKGKRPRLIHDVYGNIILVQRLYLCVRGKNTHKITATSPDLMIKLPSWIQTSFPVRLSQRSGCSRKLLQYMLSAVVEGVSFLKISEGIASLNHGEHTMLGLTYNDAINDGSTSGEPYNFDDFYTNDIFSFPSNDQLMRVFLEQFQLDKDAYISEMRNVRETAIACDHTFRVSRNIGVVTEGKEDRFLKQFSNLYIVLNEHGEIFDWRLTKTTAFDEIDDLLIDLRDRLSIQNHPIQTICIDDCCKNRQKYQSIFPNASVKLDLFHGCQRVIRALPNKHVLRSQFAKEFGLIFRENDDLGEQRLKSTPNESQIEGNLDALLKKWMQIPGTCLTEETLKQIDGLRVHIKKGCLSGIPPGFGTEKNEQLHRLLNRSLLSGATRINVELAVALLSVLFYYHSKRVASNRKHSCSSRIQCVPPIRRHSKEAADVPSKDWSPFKKQEGEYPTESTVSHNHQEPTELNSESIVIPHTIEDVCSEMVAESILKVAIGNYGTISAFSEYNCNRSVNADDLLLLSNISAGLTMYHEENEEDCYDPVVAEHVQTLSRNLGGFKLTTDAVSKDGDCAFRSIARMISSICNQEQPDVLITHLSSIGLYKSEDEDAITMRHLFVDEIMKSDDDLLAFFPDQDKEAFVARALEFRRQGVFDTAIGDLVMRVCAQLLRVPIVVVTSLNSLPCVPFLPNNPLSSKPIFVAYHYYGAGHYDATKPLGEHDSGESDTQISATLPSANGKGDNGCSCGSKIKSRDKVACANNGGKSRCPCVKRGQACNRDLCKCRSCGNVDKKCKEKLEARCRFGEGKRGEETSSCVDVEGQQRTRCPCFTAGSGCKDCKCYNCQNSFGVNNMNTPTKGKDHHRKRKSMLSTPPSLKRSRGTEYLRENNVENIRGGWSLLENCILDMTESFILSSSLEHTKHNIFILFNFVINSEFAKNKAMNLSHKTLAQISGKLAYKSRRMEAIWQLASGQSESKSD